MKKIFFAASMLVLISCGTNRDLSLKYASTITAEELKTHLFIYASDEHEGRETGSPGQKKAVEYLKKFYVKEGIASPLGGDNYFQEVPASFIRTFPRGRKLNDSENVLAFIKGSEKPNEIVVVSSHLDHIGMTQDGKINNGADDDGSGTVALLEIAQAFRQAEKKGHGPKRSLLFLHVTGEERGLIGSDYYAQNPVFPLENTVTDLNIDMIGRVDPKHKENTNYLYLVGSDKLSTELHDLSEAINKKYTNFEFDYLYNDEAHPSRIYYRSDHYNFAKHNIPVIFYFNGIHEDYHRPSDTPDKINYELLEKRTKLVFHTAWEVANRKDRIIVDKAVKKEEKSE